MKILSYRSLFFLLLLILTCFSCKKYTNNQEQYVITFESSYPIEKVSYVITKPDKGEFVQIDAFASVLAGGFLKPLNDYEFILDTSLITDDLYYIGITYYYDIPPGDTLDANIEVSMTKTETNEIFFQKSFHEDDEIGSFRINL